MPQSQLLVQFDCGSIHEDRRTVLHHAAENGRAQICATLLTHDADPLLLDGKNKTAQDLAMESGHADCASVMRAWASSQAARQALQEIGATLSMK